MTVQAASDKMGNRSPEDWLLRYLRLQKRYDTSLNALLVDASRDAEQQIDALVVFSGIGGQVRAMQLKQATIAIQEALRLFWKNTGDVVKAGRIEAAETAAGMGFDWDAVLLREVFPALADRKAMRASLIATARFNVEAALARVVKSYVPLSERVYRTEALSARWVDRKVNSALSRGATAAELAKEVRQFIRPDTPGGVSYAAQRLARTEINNAYHATTIEQQRDKPWNEGMVWRLSGSHSNPDICDAYARKIWPINDVPEKAHPHCFCTVFPRTTSPEQFIQEFHSGEYDDYLDRVM
jgi:hypothetical protein